MTAVRKLTIEITLPVESEDGETFLSSRPTSIVATGLTAEEGDHLAEAWAQSDNYWVNVTSAIIDALARIP